MGQAAGSTSPPNCTASIPGFRGWCRKCGYNLHALTENRCPECGRPFDPVNSKTFTLRPGLLTFLRRLRRILLCLILFLALISAYAFWNYRQWSAEQPAITQLKGGGSWRYGTVKLRRSAPAIVQWAYGRRFGYLLDRAADVHVQRISRHISEEGFDIYRLQDFQQLQKLDIYAPGLHDEDVELVGRLRSLEELALYAGNLSDNGLKPLSNLTRLRLLRLRVRPANFGFIDSRRGDEPAGVCEVGENALSAISSLKNLEELRLTGTRLDRLALRHLYGMPRLRLIGFQNTAVFGIDILHLRQHLSEAKVPFPAGCWIDPTPPTDPALKQSLSRDPPSAQLDTVRALRSIGVGVHVRVELQDGVAVATEAEVSGNNINDAALALLAQLPTLRRLVIISPTVTDAGLIQLFTLSQLRELELRCQNMTDPAVASLAMLPNLESLKLTSHRLTDAATEHLPAHLTTLDLAGTPITDASLPRIAAISTLQDLRLSRITRITDAGLNCLSSLPNLQSLDLDATTISDAGLEQIGRLHQLQRLQLAWCIHAGRPTITPKGLAALRNLSNLRELSLAGSAIDDNSLAHIEKMLQLQTLNLSNTKVTDAGIPRLRPLIHIKSLYLSSLSLDEKSLLNLVDMDDLRRLEW